MDKVIVYLDDASHAREQFRAGAGPTHWLLVACAPRMTHRVSKWVSHSARENWRAKWADKLFGQVVPPLRARGDTVTPILARGPLPELTRSLLAEHGNARVIDARRPKSADGGGGEAAGWSPGPTLGLGASLFCAFAAFET
jgi:hypothetical protein